MHLWTIERWRHILPSERVTEKNRVAVYCDHGIHPEVRDAMRAFVSWMKREYFFPLPLRVYVRDAARLRCQDGDWAVGTFFEPDDPDGSPYIRVAAGDYPELREEMGRDSALATLLGVVAHECTHYFQWVNGLTLTERGRERQANAYADSILDEYAQTRDHP